MLSRTSSLLLLTAVLSVGCAGPNGMAAKAPHIPYADLEGGRAEKHVGALSQLPYVLEFKAGQEIPLHFSVESGLVELAVPTLRIRVKRDFWVLVRPKGAPLLSEDGTNFTEKAQNSFGFGLKVTRDEAPSLQGKIRFRADP